MPGGIYYASTSLEVQSCNFAFNEVFEGSCGGMLIVNCEGGSIIDSNFTFNKAMVDVNHVMEANGGGLCIERSGFIVIRNSNLNFNFAISNGGAVAFVDAFNISASKSTFESNYAGSGGTMGIINSAFINMSNLVIKNSSAVEDGGSLFVQGSEGVAIQHSQFVNSHSLSGFGSSVW